MKVGVASTGMLDPCLSGEDAETEIIRVAGVTDSKTSQDVGLLLPLSEIVLYAISKDDACGDPPRVYVQIGEGEEELNFFVARPDFELAQVFEALCSAMEKLPLDTSDADVDESVMLSEERANMLGRLDAMLLEGGASDLRPQEQCFDTTSANIVDGMDSLHFEDAEECPIENPGTVFPR